MERRYCKHVICQTCMQHWQCLSCQHCERFCAGECLIQPYLSLLDFWFLKHHHSAATHHYHRRCEMQLAYQWKFHACRANNYYFLYIYFLFFALCILYCFQLYLDRTIATVYTDNIFLYNYLRQIHQIIHLSPVGCFTPARGKGMQKRG